MDLSKVLKGPKVAAAVQAKAEKVKDYWQSVSPVFGESAPTHRAAPAHGSPGDYKSSVHVTDMSDDDGARARVSDDDFKAKWIEFGNKHQKPIAPLAKTKARFR